MWSPERSWDWWVRMVPENRRWWNVSSERIRKTKGYNIRRQRGKFLWPKEALENGVAMVHRGLNQCLERSVIDNLFLGRYPKNSLGVVDEGRMKKEASDLFRKLGITVNLTQPMKRMSVSKRQMCEIVKSNLFIIPRSLYWMSQPHHWQHRKLPSFSRWWDNWRHRYFPDLYLT